MAKKAQAGPTSDPQQLHAKDAVRLALALEPSRLDEPVIREILGDRAVKSLSEVAQAFGVAAATVRHTWRRDGMPGDAKQKRFVLADVLVWWLRRAEANSKARGADEYTKRKREAETTTAEVEAQLKQLRLERETGEFVSVALVRSELGSALSMLRDDLMTMPEQLMPSLPAKQAGAIAAEIERQIGIFLTGLADRYDRMIDDDLERTSDGEEND